MFSVDKGGRQLVIYTRTKQVEDNGWESEASRQRAGIKW